MRETALFVALVLALLAMHDAQAQVPLPEIQTKATAGWAQVNSLTAKTSVWSTMHVGDNPQEMRASGTVSFLRDNGQEKYQQQMTLVSKQYSAVPSVRSVYDGEHLFEWVVTAYPGGCKQVECDLSKGRFWPGGELLFKLLNEQYTVSAKADSTCGNRPVYVLEGTPKQPLSTAPWRKALFSVDQALGLLVRVELCDVNGVPVSVMELSDPHLNAEVNKEQFTLPTGGKMHSVKR
ncbi:MAG TPA: hypothetical protein PLI09_00910 [Candidatus Hydrogenedentes bacterium]|nr:hypothetical protein [Candidatus Hydrogenedentota bacterium]